MRFACIAISCILGWEVHARATTTDDPYAEANASWERFGAVYSRIIDNYYDDLNQEKIMAAINRMRRNLLTWLMIGQPKSMACSSSAS